jgi:hypothetical protein
MFVEIQKTSRGRKPNVGSAIKTEGRVSFMLGYSCCPTCRDTFRVSVPLGSINEFMGVVSYKPQRIKMKKRVAAKLVKWFDE